MNRVTARLGRVLRSPKLAVQATLIRFAPGDYAEDGEFVPGPATRTPVRVVTDPLDGEKRQQLPEGLRELDVRRFWTTAQADAIRASESGGDMLRYRGISYRIVMLKEWSGFCELVGVRPDT